MKNGIEINVLSEELQEFYELNKTKLVSNYAPVARNTETGYTIYLGSDGLCPVFDVYRNNEFEAERAVQYDEDCGEVGEILYYEYLIPVEEITAEDDDLLALEDGIEMDSEYIVSERGAQLLEATRKYLAILFGCDKDEVEEEYGKSVCEDFLDCACELLSRDFSISVYFPTIRIGKDGTSKIVEFPFD